MTPGLRIAIVGVGIGGLSAALALRAAGHDVLAYEQASALGEVGAGVGVAPNGMRMLERLGLRERIEAVAAPYGAGSEYFDMHGGHVGAMTTSDSAGEYVTLGLHRADLIGVLAAALPADAVRTGHRLTALEQDDDGVTLHFDGRPSARADLVIGADGIHSTVRAALISDVREPVSSRSIAYRGLVPADRVPEWPRGIAQLWMGEGKHFLTYPVRRGELINYVGFVPRDEQLTESWSAVGDVTSLRADFAGWDRRVGRLLAAVDRTFWWGLYDREPLSHWSEGRVTLLGDAAHAMLPHLGQGANQAVEDALTLAVLLEGVSAAGIERALADYQRLRLERTAAVQSGARDNGRRYDSDYEDIAQRDTEIRESGGLRLWLYDYDAAGLAEQTKESHAIDGA